MKGSSGAESATQGTEALRPEARYELEDGHDLPAHLRSMPVAEFDDLLDFANDVQAWALEHFSTATIGGAAEHFGVSIERAADAVHAHYWIFPSNTDAPLAEWKIEHEGE